MWRAFSSKGRPCYCYLYFSTSLWCIKIIIKAPPHSYGASLATWDHTVLPSTQHKWTQPALTAARQAGIWSTYPEGMEGWVDLCRLLTVPWFAVVCSVLDGMQWRVIVCVQGWSSVVEVLVLVAVVCPVLGSMQWRVAVCVQGRSVCKEAWTRREANWWFRRREAAMDRGGR